MQEVGVSVDRWGDGGGGPGILHGEMYFSSYPDHPPGK